MNEVKVVTGALHRVRRGRGKGFVSGRPTAPPPLIERPARVAVMLAFAHLAQRAIDRGEIKDRAELAMRLGVTRARITQLLDAALVPPSAQNEILAAHARRQ